MKRPREAEDNDEELLVFKRIKRARTWNFMETSEKKKIWRRRSLSLCSTRSGGWRPPRIPMQNFGRRSGMKTLRGFSMNSTGSERKKGSSMYKNMEVEEELKKVKRRLSSAKALKMLN